MFITNKTCKSHPINAKKNHAKMSLPVNYHVNKWGVAYCVVAVMVMIHDYYNNTLWLETLVDIKLHP